MRREQNFKLTGNRTGAHLWYRCSTWRRSIVLDENSHISEHFGEQHMSHLHISLRQSTFTAAESGIPMIEYYNFTSIEAAKGFKFVIHLASTSAAGDSFELFSGLSFSAGLYLGRYRAYTHPWLSSVPNCQVQATRPWIIAPIARRRVCYVVVL